MAQGAERGTSGKPERGSPPFLQRGLPPTGRTLAFFWANPWAFALYGLLLALPLLVFVVRAHRGDLHVAVPILYGGAAALFLAYSALASALRVCERGVVVPESYRTITNLWFPPEFVPWTGVSAVANRRPGITLDLVDGGEVVLPGYDRRKLEPKLKGAFAAARGGNKA